MAGNLKDISAFVTGATGFIGSHLTRRLVHEGAEVSIIARPNSKTFRIDDILDKIRIYRLDLIDFNLVKQAVKDTKPQKVFHLAGHTNVERGFKTANDSVKDVQYTVNLLRSLQDIAHDCFIYTGTCEEYGDNPAPFREDQNPNPVSAYSASRVASTAYCQMFHKTLGCPIIILRPFFTYGPYQKASRFISNVILSGLKGEVLNMTWGEQTREFNYVSDIVDGFIKASVNKEAIGEIINIGNGIEFTLKEMVEKVSAIMGNRLKVKYGALPYRPGETWHFYCDNTKAKRLLNWEPKMDLETGLRMTIDWYTKFYKILLKEESCEGC
ncbi:MAG: NAD-dependent epimerase/dehydratase family protein [Candidatus Scalinduaceae bacterium]